MDSHHQKGMSVQRRSLFALGAVLWAAAWPARAAKPRAVAKALQVEAVQMPAWAFAAGGRKLPLAPGMLISTEQEVHTAEAAALALRMPEGSMIRLGENTRLGVLKMTVDPSTGRTAVQAELKLFDGVFRFATGALAKVAGERKIDVTLRTATIGIRGTDFWSMTDEKHDATCLFEGQVDLATRDQGALTLDKPTAFWARFFEQPVRPVGNATPDQLAQFLKSTELEPGKGVAVLDGRWRVVAATLADQGPALELMRRLRDLGYPAMVREKSAQAGTGFEVRINGFVTREDAQAILRKIEGVPGVSGRVALST